MSHSLTNIRKLRHVVALATHGSYVGAARELNLSPSALSRSIQSVEEDMKLVLFTRGKGGVFITPAGTRVVNGAHILMQAMNDLQDSLRNLHKAEIGDAAFGIGPLASAALLPALFERSLSDNKVRVHAHIDSGPVLLDLLNSGKIEFFLCTRGAVGRLPNIRIEPVASIQTSLRVRSGHPLAGKKRVTRDMLDQFRLVGGNFEENAKLNIRASLPYDPAVICNNYHIFAEVLKHSDAVCHFPNNMPTDRLVTLNCAPGVYLETLPIVLCRLRSRPLSKASVEILQRLRETIADLGLGFNESDTLR